VETTCWDVDERRRVAAKRISDVDERRTLLLVVVLAVAERPSESRRWRLGDLFLLLLVLLLRLALLRTTSDVAVSAASAAAATTAAATVAAILSCFILFDESRREDVDLVEPRFCLFLDDLRCDELMGTGVSLGGGFGERDLLEESERCLLGRAPPVVVPDDDAK